MKIIDAHAHVAQYISGFTSRGELRAIGGGKAQHATGEVFQMFPPELGDTGVSPEAILSIMDKNGVDKAVLLQGNWLGFQNEYTAEAIKKYPSRFTGAATYDPFCVKVDDVRNHLFKDLGFNAVKFELSNGSGLMANHAPLYLDGKIMRGCFDDARDRGLTVVLDIGRPRNICWQIDAAAEAVLKYPQVTFVFCHLLAPQIDDEKLLSESLEKLVNLNVYFDISSLARNQQPEKYPYPTAVRHLKNAKAIVGTDRLMFGTDIPCNLVHDSYSNLKDYVINSGVFSNRELEDVFYNTAEKVYFS